MSREYFESNKVLNENKYIVLKDFIPQFVINKLYGWYNDNRSKFTLRSEQGLAYNAYCCFDNDTFLSLNTLFDVLTPRVESITKSKLIPTYNYGRVYTKDSYMDKHKDRAQCDLSMTLTIAFNNRTPWPINLKNPVTNEEKEVSLYSGDALIYRGGEIQHWRTPNKSNTIQYQHFFHWIDTESECGKFMSQFSLEEIKDHTLWPLPFDQMKLKGILPTPRNKNVQI